MQDVLAEFVTSCLAKSPDRLLCGKLVVLVNDVPMGLMEEVRNFVSNV